MIRTIVHYIDADIFGGCEEIALLLLAGLDRCRWRPVLFHHGGPGISRVIDEVTRLNIASRVVPRMSSRNLPFTIREWKQALRTEESAVLHVHLNWPLACRYPVIAARLARVPAVVATAHLHSSLDEIRFGRLKHRIHAACIDRFFAVSNEVRDRLCSDLHVQATKVRVVRNGIRLAEPTRPDPALRASLTNGSARPIVFTPARLHSQKGHIYLLEAAALIPDAVFVFAGDGPERAALESQARTLGIDDRVCFLGQRADVPQLLASCDLFVLPSLYEGLPLSVLEAMAAKKPVVATRIGGTDEAVIDGVTGLLASPRNPGELAAAIARLLEDPDLAGHFADAGHSRVVSEFSSGLMVRRVASAYEELLSSAQN